MSDVKVKGRGAATVLLEPPQARRAPSVFGRAQQLINKTPRMLFVRPQAQARTRKSSGFGKGGMFFLLVILPTVAAASYLYAIASDQFVSEAKFIIRSPSKPGVSGLGAILQGSGFSGMRDDAYSVIDFIKSRDALKDIEDKVRIRDIFNRPGADFLSRFPGLGSGTEFEALYDHYQNVVNVTHDATTGIATLRVRAYNPTDSQELAEALLESSERLVNRMNERSLQDAVALAEREVKVTEDRSAAAQQALTAYRMKVGLVDMNSTAKTYLEVAGGLQKELAAARAQLIQLTSVSPNSPSLQSLRDHVSALDQQLASERGKMVGNDGSLVSTFADFERLTIEAEFAGKALVVANTMLESSRMDALRKQLYLERVVEPNLADLSRYPRRGLATITVFAVCCLAFAIIWLLVVNAREHAS